jgi:O-antigen ligase
MLCLAGIEWSIRQRRSAFWTVLLFIGFICGTSGSIFTESRGSWLALPVCLMALYCGSALKKRYLIVGTIAMMAWLFVLYAIPQTGIKERLSLVASETSAYNDANEVTTSVGARFEMWRAGALLIREKPLLGWGKEGYMNRVQQWIAKDTVGEVVGQHSHLHNEYIDAWVKRGIPGLAATLALYLVPLLLFARQFRNGKAAARPYALAGTMLTLSYIAFGLTQAFLTHDNGVMLYAFSAAILWAAARRAEPGL